VAMMLKYSFDMEGPDLIEAAVEKVLNKGLHTDIASPEEIDLRRDG
jgi:isocitrate/isopropylmalate dehydrogenase